MFKLDLLMNEILFLQEICIFFLTCTYICIMSFDIKAIIGLPCLYFSADLFNSVIHCTHYLSEERLEEGS